MQQHDVLLLKVMLVLHIARVLQHLESGSQNEGWGVHNAGNQIKVASDVPFALTSLSYLFSPLQGFGNAIIYMRPRYLRNREKNPEMSHWQAIFTEDEYDHRLGHAL